MTNEEAIKALEQQPTDKCKDCYYNDGDAHAECVVCDKESQPTDDDDIIKALKAVRTIHNGNYAPQIDEVIRRLKEQPCEDTEVIKVSKGAVKARHGRFVIYDVEWLKENFYSEEMIYGQPKQPSEDCIRRADVYGFFTRMFTSCGEMTNEDFKQGMQLIKELPSVTPKYTDEEIDRAQAVEQAYVDKMVELAVERPKGKWLAMGEGFTPYECSECEAVEFKKSNYCPNCGAEMSGGEKE